MRRPHDLITHWRAVTDPEPVPANARKPVVIPSKAPIGVPDPPTVTSQPHDLITHWRAVTDTERSEAAHAARQELLRLPGVRECVSRLAGPVSGLRQWNTIDEAARRVSAFPRKASRTQ